MRSIESEGITAGRWPEWFRRLATLNALLGVAFAAIFVYFSFRARFTVPYVDDWSWLGSLFEPYPLTHGLWSPHNEHVIVIPRLLLWTDYWLWGWPGYATLIAALVSHAVVAGAFLVACRDRDPNERRLLIGSVLVLTFLTYQLQGAVFPAAVLFPLVAAFATLAIASFAQCAGNREPRAVWRWAVVSAAMTLMAMLCLTNGLILPFILAGLALVLGLRWPVVLLFVVVGSIGFVARYELGGVPATAFSASPVAVMRFALAMLGGPIASISPRLAMWVGVCLTLLAIRALWQFLRTPVRTPAATLLAGIIMFVMASMTMAAVGRAQFDPSVAAESRYAELAAIVWAAVLLAVTPAGLARRPMGMVTAVLLPLFAIVSLPVQLLVGRVWAAKADHLDVAGLVLTVGVSDEDWTWRIQPLGAGLIQPVLPHLRARGVGFLDFPSAGQASPTPPGGPVCDGSLTAIDTGAGEAAGLRVQGHLREQGAWLRILDRERRVRGLAKHSPVVQHPRASANDFVWAEVEVARGHLSTDGDWLGFTARGADAPFAAELLDATGQRVCELPVTCCSAPPRVQSRAELVVRGGLPEGRLDVADCSAVAGWLWDAVRPDEPLEVRITISNGSEVTLSASEFRPDLVDHGKGNGRHGFSLTAPQFKLHPGTWEISASVADTGVPLSNSPQSITCK